MWLTERGFERYTNNGTRYRGLGIRERTESSTEETEGTEQENGINRAAIFSRGENWKIHSVPSADQFPTEARSRSFCPHCACDTTLLIRGESLVCYQCKKEVSPRKEPR